MALSALQYYGGKSANSASKTGTWITELLPHNKHDTYIEPFAGMLGVLLQREPVQIEIVNDSNSDLINWWLTVRDHCSEFVDKLECTPHSRELWSASKLLLSDSNVSGLDRAIAYHVCLTQSISINGGWSAKYSAGGPRDIRYAKTIPRLQKRIRDVSIENTCALKLVDRVRKLEHVVIYLDPPYEGASIDSYGDNTIDFDALRDILGKPDNKARMAISGYGNSYDCLSWNRHEKKVLEYGSTLDKKGQRTEVLWTNYDTNELIAPLFR